MTKFHTSKQTKSKKHSEWS